ncbi:asparaginyl-tRNA synthetase, partial sequence, partial [Candidatus Phytoplasma solani]
LLSKYQIKAPLLSYYQYNQKSRLSQILEFLLQGKNLALISDAGTPLISDPGFDLVEKIQKAGFNVVAIPGASAFLTAFVTSNLPAPFIFLSFLSRFRQTLEKQLLKYKYATETLIIYESPHRIKKTLSLIYQIFGNRKISLARELTKKFETIINCDLASIIHETLNHKGEYVLLVQGNPNPYQHLLLLNISEHVLFYVKLGLSQKEALSKVA